MRHELNRSFLFHQTTAGAEGTGEQAAALPMRQATSEIEIVNVWA